MSNEKKIGFKGDVSGFLSELSKANQQVKDYYNNSITNATKLSNSTKQQTEYIKLQNQETEKRIKALRQEQETLIKTFELEKKRIQDQQKTGTLSASEAKNQIKSASNTLTGQLNEGELRIKDLEKVVEILRSVKDEISLSAMKEISENKKGVLDQIKAFNKVSPDKLLEKYSPEQVMKLQKQKELLGRDSPEKKKEQSIFGAILGAEIVKGLYNKTTQAAQTFAGGTSGEQVMADLVKGIGFVVGDLVGTLMSRHMEESYKAEVGVNKLRGRGGRGGMFSYSDLGYSIAETMPIAEQATTSLGTNRDYQGVTRDVISSERAFSLDRGTLMDMLRNQRMQNDGDLSKNISVVYSTMKSKGFISDKDYTQFEEILKLQNSLVQKQAEVMDVVDPNMATGVVAAFKGVGGRYGDARAGTNINTISSGLSNPGNDFQKAMNLKVLSKLKPGASLFELEEMEEKGVMQEGFLDSFLKETEATTGGGDGMLHTIKSRFPQLGAAGTRKLVDAYQEDRDRFKGMSADDSIKELDLMGKASGLTASKEKPEARISDAFVKGEWAGMKQVAFEFGVTASKALEESGTYFGRKAAEELRNFMNLNTTPKPPTPNPKPDEGTLIKPGETRKSNLADDRYTRSNSTYDEEGTDSGMSTIPIDMMPKKSFSWF